MRDYKPIFNYNEDFYVYDMEDISGEHPRHKYSISIEGYIYFDTLEEIIDYYCIFRDEYKNYLLNNYENIDLNPKDKPLYRTYDIEIHKEPKLNKINVYVTCPEFSELKDTYLWVDGVIEQLQSIKLDK